MPVRIAQHAFSGGEIAPELVGRTDLEKYSLSLARLKNALVTKYGSVRNRSGTMFVGEVRDSSKTTRLIPFTFSTTQAYIGELGDEVWRPIMDGGQVLQSSTSITACTAASPGVFSSTSHGLSVGDRVYVTGITGLASGGLSQINGRVMIVGTVPTADSFSLTDLFGNAFNTGSLTAYSSGGSVAKLYQLTMPYDHTEVFGVDYAQTADTAYLTHLGYAPRKLTRSGHASWSISTATFGPTQAAPTSPTATNTVGTGGTTYSYKITAFNEDTGEESLPSSVASTTNDLTVAGNYNTVSWAAASGAERYIVYKAQSGVYGFIGGTTGTSFVDDNIAPDLGDTPPAARNPFGSSGNYPAVCGFHEGRLVYAQTTNTPAGVWLSQPNLYDNFSVSSPAKADDAVSFELRPGVNAVKGFASINKLCVFTSEAEFTADGGGVAQFISPASLTVRRWSQRGSSSLKPIVIGDIVLYTQRQGAVVRAFGYSFEKDGYRSNDLTLLAPHFFRGHTIVDWCYQQDPDSIVWCVRDDGALLSLTFVEDQNTFAWARHYMGGAFASGDPVVESCATIEGDEHDEVYFIVKRTVNGATKRYIEKLQPRWAPTLDSDGYATNVADAYFVDCGLTVTNSPASATVEGLWHLIGQTVVALADGNVVEDLTVSATGTVTLPYAASTVHVGLPYTSDVVDLPVAMDTAGGSPRGRPKAVSGVVLRLSHTRGLKYGSVKHASRIKEIKERQLETWDEAITPYSGDTKTLTVDGGWTLDGSVLIRQSYPLPMEILMIARDVTVGGPE